MLFQEYILMEYVLWKKQNITLSHNISFNIQQYLSVREDHILLH